MRLSIAQAECFGPEHDPGDDQEEHARDPERVAEDLRDDAQREDDRDQEQEIRVGTGSRERDRRPGPSHPAGDHEFGLVWERLRTERCIETG